MVMNVDQGVVIRYTSEGIAVYAIVGHHVRAIQDGEMRGHPDPYSPVSGDKPGYFYNDHGKEVSLAMAKSAGYDVDALIAERKKRQRISDVTQQIESEYQLTRATRDIVATKGDYRVIHIGSELYNIEDLDGTVMNTKGPVSKPVAMNILDNLVPEEVADEAVA